jgi:hypothetical protein
MKEKSDQCRVRPEGYFASTRRFMGTLRREARHGMQVNRTVREKVIIELGSRNIDIADPAIASDWDAFEQVLFRPRPRLVSAIAAYSLLTGRSFADIQQQNGMVAAKAFWMLGTIQDNLIDRLDKEKTAVMSEKERRQALYDSIFGKGREFQQATYAAILCEIATNPAYGPEHMSYLSARMDEWFDFLVTQESGVYNTPEENYTFPLCVNYRQLQNAVAGRVVVSFLNGQACLDPKLQHYEQIIPILSYRTQIMDDIGDVVEDMEMSRPSYVIGALREYPDEFETVKNIAAQKGIRKFTPHKLKKYAPQSYKLVKDTFTAYGDDLAQKYGVNGKILDKAGKAAYHTFPALRDVMYRINERYSYF